MEHPTGGFFIRSIYIALVVVGAWLHSAWRHSVLVTAILLGMNEYNMKIQGHIFKVIQLVLCDAIKIKYIMNNVPLKTRMGLGPNF